MEEKIEKSEFFESRKIKKEDGEKQKGFHITITDLDNITIVRDADSKAIIGAFSDGDGIRGLSLICADPLIVMHLLTVSKKIIKNIDFALMKNILEDLGGKDE